MVDLKKTGSNIKTGLGIIGSIYAGLETLKIITGKNSSPQTNAGEAMQADAKGRDQRHNTLFFTALAKATEELESDVHKRNAMISRFLKVLNAQSATTRKNAMLCIGQTESDHAESVNGDVIITHINVHGISILKSWLQMDEHTLQLALQSSVKSSDIFVEKVNSLNDFCKELNSALAKSREEEKLKPGYKSPQERAKEISESPWDLLKMTFGFKK